MDSGEVGAGVRHGVRGGRWGRRQGWSEESKGGEGLWIVVGLRLRYGI